MRNENELIVVLPYDMRWGRNTFSELDKDRQKELLQKINEEKIIVCGGWCKEWFVAGFKFIDGSLRKVEKIERIGNNYALITSIKQ